MLYFSTDLNNKIMENCNYNKTGEAKHMATYDVRQEYKTDCGIRHVNLQEHVWNGIEGIRIKPNGSCIYCKKPIEVVE